MSAATITYEQALLALHDHLGQQVYLGLEAQVEEIGGGWIGVIEHRGTLSHRPTTKPGSLLRDAVGLGRYVIGDQQIFLPLLPGTILQNDQGIIFAVTDGLHLRVEWLDANGGER